MTATIWLPTNQGTAYAPEAASVVAVQSPLAELTAMLHIVANPDHHGPLIGRVESFKNKLRPQVLQDIEKYSIMWRRYRARFLFPTSANEKNLLGFEIEEMYEQPIENFVQCVFWVFLGNHRDFSDDPALLEDAQFRNELVAHVRALDAPSLPLVFSLFNDPLALRDELIHAIAEAGEVFSAEIWPHISSIIYTQIQSCKDRYKAFGLAALLSSLPSTTVVENKCVQVKRTMTDEIHLGKTQMLLIPSIFTWPHFQVKTEPGYLPVTQYPIREYYVTSGGEQVQGDVQRRLAALSDSVRFDICRILARSPATTSHLAERVGVAAPHVSRHLKVLLQAGLISRMQSGKFVIYDFNSSSIIDLGSELLTEFLR